MSPTASTPPARLRRIPAPTLAAICASSVRRSFRTTSTKPAKPAAASCGRGPMCVRSRWQCALTKGGVITWSGRSITAASAAAGCASISPGPPTAITRGAPPRRTPSRRSMPPSIPTRMDPGEISPVASAIDAALKRMVRNGRSNQRPFSRRFMISRGGFRYHIEATATVRRSAAPTARARRWSTITPCSRVRE